MRVFVDAAADAVVACQKHARHLARWRFTAVRQRSQMDAGTVRVLHPNAISRGTERAGSGQRCLAREQQEQGAFRSVGEGVETAQCQHGQSTSTIQLRRINTVRPSFNAQPLQPRCHRRLYCAMRSVGQCLELCRHVVVWQAR